jgi:hypothetical protein
MAQSYEVLRMLIPNGGYVQVGEDFEGITFIEATPITKAQFEAGFATYDAWKAEQDAKAAADKLSAQEKLATIGLTIDDLKALGLR